MSERVNQLFESLQEILTRPQRQRNFMPYLLAKKDEEFYRLSLTPSDGGIEIFYDLASEYAIGLNVHAAEYGVYNFYDESPETCLLHKSFTDDEQIFFEAFPSFRLCDRRSFVLMQYDLSFLCVELPLNRTQSIHLYQYVPGSYRARDAPAITRRFMQLFEDRYLIQVSDYSEGFNIRKDFDFCSFYDSTDPSLCFSIIKARTRKWFEKMYGYIQQYRVSFDEVSRIDVLDFQLIGLGTEDTWRKCHSLLRSPLFEISLERFKEELLSDEDNTSKEFLDGKGIPYSTDNGILRVKPLTFYQAKIIIKMLEDNLVTTQYTGRDGLASYIEEV